MKSVSLASIAVVNLCAMFAAGAHAQSPASPPQPSAEIKRLTEALTGGWSLNVKFEPSSSAPNGVVNTGEETWRPGPGGFTLLEEEHLPTPEGDVFLLGIIWWNSENKSLHGMECQNMLPYTCDVKGAENDITMSWDGKQFVIDEMETSKSGKKSVWHEVWSGITSNSFTQTGEYGEPGGPRKRLFTIHATRLAATHSKNDGLGAGEVSQSSGNDGDPPAGVRSLTKAAKGDRSTTHDFPSAGATEVRTGESLAEHVAVSFSPLPPEWVSEQNAMDPIWEPLGYRGVNYYAYGKSQPGKSFAARSDSGSPLYQAWLGAYVIVGGKSVFGSGGKDAQCAAFVKLAEYDQKSWLAAMGDPHPLAEFSATRNSLTIPIDGSERTACSLEGATHSDLSSADTPLVKHMGMPPEAEWKHRVSAFHNLDLHIVGAWWYDPHRDLSVIVYTASSRFKNRAGLVKDNDVAIGTSLRQIMKQAKLVDAGGSAR